MRLESVHMVCRNTGIHLHKLKHGGACTRWHRKGGILNPASMKQALVEGAERIPGINLYEQGAGKMNLLNSTVSTLLDGSPQGLADACASCNGWAALPLSMLLLMSLMLDGTWWHELHAPGSRRTERSCSLLSLSSRQRYAPHL